MKSYVKLYLDFFGYTKADIILCEICNNQAVDIAHIKALGMGGTKKPDDINNLQALCRPCHAKYGDRKQHRGWLQQVHDNVVAARLKAIK